MRVMEIELRTWYGAPGYFVLGAVHAQQLRVRRRTRAQQAQPRRLVLGALVRRGLEAGH